MKKILFYLILLLFFGIPFSALAENQQISLGFSWLINAKNGHTYWGCKIPADQEIDELTDTDIVPTYFRDTHEATNTLFLLNQTVSDYNDAINWFFENKPKTTEQLSRKIELLSRTSFPFTDELNLLLSYQNADGGFGGYGKLRSNVIDSMYALKALVLANYQDNSVIGRVLQYILNSQNSDGGWGFKYGMESKLSYTALVSMTLQQFPQTSSLATAINRATSYLISHQNTDGGFGSSPSTVFETAYAYMALSSVTTDGTVLGNAVNYLKTTQSSNGSWLDDPYSTALALNYKQN